MVESTLSSQAPFRESALDEFHLRKNPKSNILTYVLLAMLVLLVGVSIWKTLPATNNTRGVQVVVGAGPSFRERG